MEAYLVYLACKIGVSANFSPCFLESGPLRLPCTDSGHFDIAAVAIILLGSVLPYCQFLS